MEANRINSLVDETISLSLILLHHREAMEARLRRNASLCVRRHTTVCFGLGESAGQRRVEPLY